jgi:glycerol-3-phosphate dehydrogenase
MLEKAMAIILFSVEVQKLLQNQARHVAHLLELKRTSLHNYVRDQTDLLSERRRLERETAHLRAQNEKHSRREMERENREMQEARKQKKLDEIRHAEEKFSFRLSELRRPPYSEGGVKDLRYWKTGRG